MFLWFAGGAVVVVWAVFRDTAIDYRLVALGAVLPDVIDGLWGGARALHSVVTSVVLLAVVMLATVHRRAARRRLLALPIGTFLHLVLDGAWGETAVFWWPLSGWSFDDHRLPSLERGAWSLALEVLGAAALLWFWRRFDLADPGRRERFWRTGRLDRSLAV